MIEALFYLLLAICFVGIFYDVVRTKTHKHRLPNGNMIIITHSFLKWNVRVDMKDPMTRENFRKATEKYRGL